MCMGTTVLRSRVSNSDLRFYNRCGRRDGPYFKSASLVQCELLHGALTTCLSVCLYCFNKLGNIFRRNHMLAVMEMNWATLFKLVEQWNRHSEIRCDEESNCWVIPLCFASSVSTYCIVMHTWSIFMNGLQHVTHIAVHKNMYVKAIHPFV